MPSSPSPPPRRTCRRPRRCPRSSRRRRSPPRRRRRPSCPGPTRRSTTSPRVPPPGPGEVRVRIATSDGTIVVDLDRAHAPLTTANFLKYVDQHRFDGTTFYRADVVDAASHLGLIQGGVRGNPKLILPPVAHEPTTKTGLAHAEGTISMARLAPGSARGDFFITTGPLSSLDAHPQAAGDNAGFAAFGQVVAGMDVVRHILSSPVSDTGEGAMRGQLLVKPVKIVTVRRGG